MIEIFRDISLIKVGHYQAILEDVGIQTFMRNENLALTEVPIPVFYPALCVMNKDDHQKALDTLQKAIKKEQTEIDSPDINCPSCDELNPATFETCWSCSAVLIKAESNA